MMTFLATTVSLFHYVNVPVEPMREAPSVTSEIVSQAFFSEMVIPSKEVKDAKESEGWVEVETAVDHYRGWVRKSVLCSRMEPFPSPSPKCTYVKVNRLAAHLYAVEDTIYGPLLTLPFESQLQCVEFVKGSNSRWIKVLLPDGCQAYIQRGDVREAGATDDPLTVEEMCAFSARFMGLPYTWGGRSSFGYDCSGFVQMLYRQMGVYLPRDAKDQIRWEGLKPVSLDQLLPGDLVFFGLTEEKIRHVGMYLKEGCFVHATIAENAPYIHLSNLNDPEWNGTTKWGYRAARRLK